MKLLPVYWLCAFIVIAASCKKSPNNNTTGTDTRPVINVPWAKIAGTHSCHGETFGYDGKYDSAGHFTQTNSYRDTIVGLKVTVQIIDDSSISVDTPGMQQSWVYKLWRYDTLNQIVYIGVPRNMIFYYMVKDSFNLEHIITPASGSYEYGLELYTN